MPRHKNPLSPTERFLTMFTVSSVSSHACSPCWEWVSRLTGNGYGQMWDSDKRTTVMAHRFSYEYHVGPIPKGMQIDHLCRNRICVNPGHFELATPKINTLRSTSNSAKNALVTHCIRGHPLSGKNLYRTKFGRVCRECSKRRSLEWYRAKRAGKVTVPRVAKLSKRHTPIGLFKQKFIVSTEQFHAGTPCWLWIGSKDQKGYGYFWNKYKGKRGKMVRAHRWAYEHYVAEIAEGLQLDHLCRVRNCVNPAHLEPVTPQVNTLRGNSVSSRCAQQTHCVNGHPFSGKNLILVAFGKSRRRCRECKIMAAREAYRRKHPGSKHRV